MQERFADVVDAVYSLSFDEREDLFEILKLQMRKDRREELRREIEQANAEYEAGLCRTATVEEIMAEIRS